MTNTIVPNFIMKASEVLNGRQRQGASVSLTTDAHSEPIHESGYSTNGRINPRGTFDFKFDLVYSNSLAERSQCQDAYDKWLKSDDYVATTSSYNTLTAKQNACNSLSNKVKNFFGFGQKWTESDQNRYNILMDHIDFMTTRGGVGE